MTDKKFLADMWNDIMISLEVPPYQAWPVFDRICSAYEATGRHYRTLGHIRTCIDHVLKIKHMVLDYDEVIFAIFLHDFVQTETGQNDVPRSVLAAQEIADELGLGADFKIVVGEIIMATSHTEGNNISFDGDIVADADLSILASDETVYRTYMANVRKEYPSIPDDKFYPERLQILKMFLDRKALYRTNRFEKELTDRARRNLQMEIDEIEARLTEKPRV